MLQGLTDCSKHIGYTGPSVGEISENKPLYLLMSISFPSPRQSRWFASMGNLLVTSQHTGFFKKIKDIFFLENEDTFIRPDNFSSKKLSQFSQVLDFKFPNQIVFQDISSESFLVTTMSSTYTIKYNSLIIEMLDEYSMISITWVIPQSCYSFAEPVKPGSERCFKPYNAFFNLRTLCQFSDKKNQEYNHIDLFLQVTMYKRILHIKLVQLSSKVGRTREQDRNLS